jgi:hypothetical protein
MSDEGFADVQAGVGRAGATLRVAAAWMFVVAGLIMTVAGTINWVKGKKGAPTPDDPKGQSATVLLFWGLGVLAFGALFVFAARAWQKEVNHNKSFAEFSGTLDEIGMVSNLLRR